MNVTVSVLGRFHAFYLARELESRGHLRRLITTYPRFKVKEWEVSGDRCRSLWPLAVLNRLNRMLPSSVANTLKFPQLVKKSFEWWAAQHIPSDTQLLVAWSGTAETGLRRARETGAATIVERGSSHIRRQRELLLEEYRRHDLEPEVPSSREVRKEETEYDLADYVAIPSKFVENSFRKQGISRDRLIRVPYGVNASTFQPVEKQDDVFRVVYAGHLSVRKGTIYLLKAFAQLDLPHSELLLLGKVEDEVEPWLNRYREWIRHPGHLPQAELPRWYSQGSVFVMPSIEEGMAMVQLQALSCELPLICTAHTGGEDLIREGKEGFVVPIRDVEALKEKILWCYQNRNQCREMGRSARRRILNEFTWQDYGSRITRAYREVLGEEP